MPSGRIFMHIAMAAWSICQGKGGGERMAALVATEMVKRGHRVTFFHRFPEYDRPVFELPDAVRLVGLKVTRSHLARSARMVRDCDPDLFFVFAGGHDLPHAPALLRGSGIPSIMGLHHNPAAIMSYALPEYEYFGALAAADFIHVIAPWQRAQLPPALQERVEIIPNCVFPAQASAPALADKKGNLVLGLGRFEEQCKQFSLLLQAFALLAPDFPDWNLALCGDGKARDLYRSFINAAGLEGRIILPGMVDDVDAWYASTDIFCIPSAFEAQPMALLEAAAHGLPLVGFAGCRGVSSMIVHGENGLLAPDMTAQSLAAILGELMADKDKRQAMGQRAAAGFKDHDPQLIFDRLEALLQRCAALKGKTRLDRLGPQAIWSEDDLNRAAINMLRPDYVPLPPPGEHLSFIEEREDMTRAEVRAMRVYDFLPRLVNRLLSLPLFRDLNRRALSSDLEDWSLYLRYLPWDYSLRKERLLTPGQQWALWLFRMPKWLGRYARRRLPLLWRRFVADFYRYATPPGSLFRPLPQEEDSSPLPEEANGQRSNPRTQD